MRARLRFAALALPVVLLLAACEDPAPPESPVALPTVAIPGGQDACQLLTSTQVQPALAPPSQSPAATPAGAASPRPSVHVSPTKVGDALATNFVVNQCTYTDVNGQSIVVTIYAPQTAGQVTFGGKLTELPDLTQNATPVPIGTTTAFFSQTATSAVMALERGGFVLTIAYPVGEPAGGPSREQRLANLVAAILGVAPPSLPPASAPVAQATPSASATAAPPAGQPTNGATAAVAVNETDALVFDPNAVTVKVGDVVQWKNGGAQVHNVVFGSQKTLNSPTMSGGDTFEVKFTVAGSYSYVCSFHVTQGMTGKVTVTS
jgi:plastocyanin